jgi:hypothetical protein
VKVSKNMEWAFPFLHNSGLVGKLCAVQGYTVPVGKEVKTQGLCTVRGSKFEIRICLNRTYDHYTTSRAAVLEDLLFTLAHELAHTVVWEHSPEHTEITAELLAEFAKTAKRLGVKDTSKRLLRGKR